MDHSQAWLVERGFSLGSNYDEFMRTIQSKHGRLHRFPITEAIVRSLITRFPLDPSRWPQIRPPRQAHLENMPLELLFIIYQQLPVKALSNLLCLNSNLQEKLVPHMDDIAYNGMMNIELWYFP